MSKSQLYSFSKETEKKMKEFRLGTSRKKDMQAVIYIIDQKTQEIRPADADPTDNEPADKDKTVSSNLKDLADNFPESSPRFIIDQKPQEIRPADVDPTDNEPADKDKTVYSNLEDLVDDLPESSPRFILLSYPFKTKEGRLSVPYVLLYWLPQACSVNLRMSYAGATEFMRNTAEVQRVIEVVKENDDDDEADTVNYIKTKLTESN